MTYSYSPSQHSDNGQSSLTDVLPGNGYCHSPNRTLGIEHSPSVDQISNNGSSHPSSNAGYRGFKTRDTMTYLEVPRIFYPSNLCVPRSPTPQSLTTYNATTNLTNTLFNFRDAPSTQPHVDTQTIVVSCAVIQTASLGIFFGPNSKHNFSLFLDDKPPHGISNVAAEIFAVHKSLKLARNIANVFGPDRIAIMKIVIATSCAPVVRAMTQWIDDPDKKDSSTASGCFESDPKHRAAYERLDKLIEETVDEDGLEVELWLVGPEGVIEAEELARRELDSANLVPANPCIKK